jgi:hypothetical protein
MINFTKQQKINKKSRIFYLEVMGVILVANLLLVILLILHYQIKLFQNLNNKLMIQM